MVYNLCIINCYTRYLYTITRIYGNISYECMNVGMYECTYDVPV